MKGNKINIVSALLLFAVLAGIGPALGAPNITGYSPLTPSVSSTALSGPTAFNITVNETTNVTWYINGTLVQTNAKVTAATYTNTSAALGSWNVTAIATDVNGTATQTWLWSVTAPGGGPVIITSSPPSPFSDVAGNPRAFSVTSNQTVSVTWYINGTPVQTKSANASTAATYTNTSAVLGSWNVTATASNTYGTISNTWSWNVINSPVSPPPPVPQTIGLQDISISFLQTNNTYPAKGPLNATNNGQQACRQCHQSTGTNISGGYSNTIGGVDTRHHDLVSRVINPYTNTLFGCQDCHPPSTTVGAAGAVLLDHSCVDCHNGSNFWADNKSVASYLLANASVGNFSRPHHVITNYTDVVGFGNPAANRTCDVCHGSFVNNYNDGHYIPSYDTSFMITPFASFKATDTSKPDGLGNLQGGNINLLTKVVGASPTGGWKVWGGCYSCHLSNYSAKPQPIGSNHDNHHLSILGISANSGGVGHQSDATPFNLNGGSPLNNRACFVCHVISWSATSAGPYEPTIIDGGTGVAEQAMELRNSTIEAASALEPFNITINGVDTGVPNTNVTFNGTGCEKCHSVASLHSIQGGGYVANGPAGLGHINNNTDCNGCHASWKAVDSVSPSPIVPTVDSVSPSVIQAGTANTITIAGSNFVNGAYTSVVVVDGKTYQPTSITDKQIVAKIPALTAGTHLIRLVKDGSSLSKLSTLTVVSDPTITSAKLVTTKQGKNSVLTLTVNGKGFGAAKPAKNPLMYISIQHAGAQITAQSISTWKDGQIVAVYPTNSAVAGDIVTVLTAASGEAQAQIN